MKTLIYILLGALLFSCATTEESRLPEGVVATVFKENITQEEYDKQLNNYLSVYNSQSENAPEDEELKQIKEDLLNSLIDRRIYLRKFDDYGLVQDPSVVEKQLTQIEESFGSPEAYDAELTKNGLTRESFKDEVSYQLKMRELGNHVMSLDWNITQEDIDNYYQENRKEFYDKDRVKAKASHILIKTDDKSEEEALNQITKIKTEIDNGKEFAEAAKEYSQCPSSEDGGYLGEFGQGAMVKEFDQRVFTMELNTVSDPVKTQFGYHLILTTDRVDSAYVPQEELTEYLTSKLKEERFISQSKEEAGIIKLEWPE